MYAIGKDQDDVKVGEWVMVAHGRWSRALKIKKDGQELEVRMIDENDIFNDDFKDIKFGYLDKEFAKKQELLSFKIEAKLK